MTLPWTSCLIVSFCVQGVQFAAAQLGPNEHFERWRPAALSVERQASGAAGSGAGAGSMPSAPPLPLNLMDPISGYETLHAGARTCCKCESPARVNIDSTLLLNSWTRSEWSDDDDDTFANLTPSRRSGFTLQCTLYSTVHYIMQIHECILTSRKLSYS